MKKKVTNLVAGLFADQALIDIHKVLDKSTEQLRAKLLKSSEFKKLQVQLKKLQAANNQFNARKDAFAKKYNVNINISSGKLYLGTRKKSLPSRNELINKIMLASHVNGVPQEKLIETVIKQCI